MFAQIIYSLLIGLMVLGMALGAWATMAGLLAAAMRYNPIGLAPDWRPGAIVGTGGLLLYVAASVALLGGL